MTPHKYPYIWKLSDMDKVKPNGYTAASIFAGGGGSSMGLKLAGFNVIGCLEIDPKMMGAYRVNLNPQYSYCEDIREFNKRDDLPSEFYNLDLLDMSPPCTPFSEIRNRDREERWGTETASKEGNKKQRLDDLFFHGIDLAAKLMPSVVVAENVTGLVKGKAKIFSAAIFDAFNKAGYSVSFHLLNASKMGVPQRRERVFFIGLRNDLAGPFLESDGLFRFSPKLILDFDEPPISYGEIEDIGAAKGYANLAPSILKMWENAKPGERMARTGKNSNGHGYTKALRKNVLPTITAHRDCGPYHPDIPRMLTESELIQAASFPTDYNFGRPGAIVKYITGMSYPPVMAAQIANKIRRRWLDELEK